MSTPLPVLAAAFADAPGAMLAAVLDQSADCIKVIGVDGTIEYMNRNGQCAMEVDDFCAIAGQPWTALWPDAAGPMIATALATARDGRSARFEAFCPTAKGTPRWWDVGVAPLRAPDGTLVGFIATSRDVTERVNAFTLRDAVADEMRHRLRNYYAVVGSLFSAHARDAPEHQPFVRDMLQRLSALGVAQTLRADRGERADLADLLPALLTPYATPACPIVIGALPAVVLDQPRIDALALALGELAVNSTKHGALSATGRIDVDGRLSDGRLAIAWSERSDRAVVGHDRDGGQGFKLIRRVLGSRGGALDLVWGAHGLGATMTLAVDPGEVSAAG